MPQFIYKAKQGPQKIVEGTVDADTLDGAVAKILQLGFTPIDVKDKRRRASSSRVREGGARFLSGRDKGLKAKKSFRPFFNFSQQVPFGELTLFTRQVSDLIDAGVPVLRSLGIIRKQTRHQRLREVIDQIHAAIKDGGTFSSALAQFPDIFPVLYVNMVKSGEVGGNLTIVFQRLAEYVEKEQETRAQIKTSLLYPAFILVVGSLTIFALLTWVIPRITSIFEEMSETLPLPTVILVGLSDFFSRFWWVVVGLIACLCFYIRRVGSTLNGRLWLDGQKLKIPFLGDFLKDVETGRFARTLGTLLDSGVVIVSALESVCLVMENAVLQQEVRKITRDVANGASLTNALKENALFPEAVINMVAVGEESGRIHDGLYKLASFYERRAEKAVKGMTSLLEPVMILVMGGIVGFIVIAMLLPIFRMNLMIN